LEAWTPEGHEKEGRDKVRRNIGANTHYKELFTEGSHVLEWYRRLDSESDPEALPSKKSLTCLLNPFEASDSSNWGWDENGKLYPVDVETVSVINRNTGEIEPVVEKWAKGQLTPQ
jgi:hypothetical protein